MAYQSKYTGLQIDDILDSVEWKEGKIEDLEQIRAGAQKGATALQSYTEKYTGTVTGIKINGETKSGSGVIDLGTISTDISGKVDKVAGKQLSTEDFTTALKTKLEGLSNYDDTELSNAVETLRGDFDEIVSGDTTTAIKTFNEVIAFLDGLTDTQDLESIIASIEQQIAGKMDTLISGTNIKTINGESILGSGDLTIESGAKVYTWNWDGSVAGTLTQEEYDGIIGADIVYVAMIGGVPIQATMGKEDGNRGIIISQFIPQESGSIFVVSLTININEDKSYNSNTKSAIIPTKTSQLDNDSNFVSSDGLKTINGESILGSGDITISGGGSGEDIRYFTEFTVEDIIEVCENADSIYDTTELFNAMESNKVICVPYRGYDKGFMVASYKSGENGKYPNMYLQKGDIEYSVSAGDQNELIGNTPTFNNTQFVEMAGGEVVIVVLDNHIYIITDPVDYLVPVLESVQKGATIQFISGENGTTLEFASTPYWANGEVPTIEPSTHYELSLVGAGAELNVVLTPFKLVE